MKKLGAIMIMALLMTAAAVCTALAADGVTITKVETLENGNVKVTWKDDERNGPYSVAYENVEGDNTYTLWIAESDITGTSCEVVDLAPGEDYNLYVIDNDFNYDYYEYQGAAALFGGSKGGTRLTVTLRQRVKGVSSTIDRFSAAAIQKALNGGNDFYGATIRTELPAVNRYMKVVFRMSAKLPTGEVIVFAVNEERISADSDYLYYDTYPFTTLWQIIQYAYEDIPTGEYTLGFYINEDYIGYQTFTVGK